MTDAKSGVMEGRRFRNVVKTQYSPLFKTNPNHTNPILPPDGCPPRASKVRAVRVTMKTGNYAKEELDFE